MASFKDWCELQARVKSDAVRKPFLLRYCYPPAARHCLSSENGDPFLAAALLPAMRTGETLDIPAHVSPKLLRATNEIQSLYRSWDKTLSQVRIKAPIRDEEYKPTNRPLLRGLFFSCGIDSFYSLFKNLADHPEDVESITDLIVVRGFDVLFERGAAVFKTMLANARTVSREVRKSVFPVATNIRDFATRFVDWGLTYHGAAMASVGLSLEAVFEKIHIASSYKHDRSVPWGSHPALDPLWSTERLSITHDSCESGRVDKTRFVAQFPIATDTLRVCTYLPFSGSMYNCGLCEKCVRTMVNLHIAGALDKCRTLPNFLDLRALRRMPIPTSEQRSYVEELVPRLGSSERDLAIRSALQEALSRKPRIRPRRTSPSPLMPIAMCAHPLLRLWVRLLRILGRSPPSSVFDLLRIVG